MAEANKQPAVEQAKKEADKQAADLKAVEDLRKNAETEAREIVEQAKKEAEAQAAQILEDARGQANDVVFRGVSKKQLVEGYNKGMNHMQLAVKYFGSNSEENIKKVRAAIDEEFGITEDIDANKEEVESK